MENDAVVRELAGAVLDGVPTDWASAESSAVDEPMRKLVRDLRLIAEIAEVHHSVSSSSDRQPHTDAERLGTVPDDEPEASAEPDAEEADDHRLVGAGHRD